MMQINKQSNQNTYEIMFLMVSVLLVFLDAYQIFGIPIPWLGMTLLFLFATPLLATQFVRRLVY